MTVPHSLAELLALERRGERPEYLYFRGHRPLPSGEIGASCLSQWWESEFTVDGITYAPAEHWMMAQKARLFGDQEIFARVVASGSPADARARHPARWRGLNLLGFALVHARGRLSAG